MKNPPLFDGAYDKWLADVPTYHSEITLRDLFAVAWLAGKSANPSCDYYPHDAADVAYDFADAMLAEREREKP